ncbi:hypothetical protein ACP4OV_004281 [Aristida adscensionis]
MARAACNHTLRLLPNPTTTQLPSCRSRAASSRRNLAVHARAPTDGDDDDASPNEPLKRVRVPQSLRRSRRRGAGARPGLVSVGTSCGGGDQWSGDFDLTLRQLHLDDLVEDGQRDADVLVQLLVQQHTQFGMSIKGRVLTSFRKICDSCSSIYCTNIDERFDVTVLSSSRKNQSGLPDLGDTDPSVIYVRPGEEVDLDPVIQETVRLTASAKSSCSEACEKSTVTVVTRRKGVRAKGGRNFLT